MKKLFSGKTLLVIGAIAVIGAAVWYIAAGDARPTDKTGSDGSILVSGKKSGKAANGAKIALNKPKRRKPGEKATAPVRPPRPDFTEEVKLSGEMRKMLLDLQNALDVEDKKKVFALVHKLQLMDEWPDGIPMAVKKKALEALAWFGAAGIAEAIGFLADSSEEIRSMAVETFERQFSDCWDLGDYKLADTLVAATKVLPYSDAIRSFYDQFGNMRNSVKGDTAKRIWESGTPQAIQVLEENLDFIFGEDVKSRKDIDKYIKEAKKAEDSLSPEEKKDLEEQYGPQDWNW